MRKNAHALPLARAPLAVMLFFLGNSATTSFAGPFVDLDLGGTCSKRNSKVLEFGDTLSVLFDDFGVRMPLGEDGDGLSTRKTCWMRLRVKPPKGFFLAGLEQVYRGGLVKSAGASARMLLRYHLASIDRSHTVRIWPIGQEIRPEDPRSVFEYRIGDKLTHSACERMIHFSVSMMIAGVRPNRNGEFILGGIDTIDMQWQQRRVELLPRWQACRSR
jgi:hypothetical protein